METVIKIRDFILEHLVVMDEDPALNDDDHFFELGFVDSLFAMQLVNFVEKEFDIAVDDSDLDLANFCSVSSIAAFIRRKKGD